MFLFGGQKVLPNGHLEIGGCDAVALAAEFGTPLYVLDEDAVRGQMRDYVRSFNELYPTTVAYAGKAFLTTAMARIVEQEGLNLDVASGGELYTALKAGFPAERLVFHGNNKSDAELAMGLDANVGCFVLDNFHELERLADLAAQRGAVARVMIRCTPGIDPHTHRLIRTGQEDTKFGLSVKDGAALEAARRICGAPSLTLEGFHCHLGSNLMDASSHVEALDVMARFVAETQRELGVEVGRLDLGGGLGVRYLPEHAPISVKEFAAKVVGALVESLDRYGAGRPHLELEPGRSIVAEAGTTLYTVGAVKEVSIPEAPGKRIYVDIDGGMSDNPRPQLYEARYHAFLADAAGSPADTTVTIAGKHCETDILIWNVVMPRPKPGDLLAVQTTGAYNYAMASNYNRLTRPAVVLVKDGRADVIVRRESLDDLVRNDLIPDRLKSAS
ncbi:MAG TPA: diaminopimelate decarboxylase [Armatimonadota bacterium]|jgi:diaminopimelate decarboxylase